MLLRSHLIHKIVAGNYKKCHVFERRAVENFFKISCWFTKTTTIQFFFEIHKSIFLCVPKLCKYQEYIQNFSPVKFSVGGENSLQLFSHVGKKFSMGREI
eukprot:TRINITY_DN17478_c0_g1_i1.p1 TRINITY_DN17478_c0_g1~~TRINITY_DN17478_c0_g1_i1.p1  ORF type:complete len:100 (-),score=10.06 TRINITY_DN17478_c0_g1_i1:39-338(-)